ncbi:MAG: DegT/DnrJ/EryC1/StrS family aminotransferase [Humidesulfovibrio sp.]|nr:DegT/DnrJ/EryC1/StrS family aminotransferase [Humidesulfovibrio sp.]
MNVPFVDLHAQYLRIKAEIDQAIASVIENSAFIRGSRVEAFEQEYAQYLGVEHCVSCASGTDALYLVLKQLGVGPGDEVITTAHSWISTSSMISQVGAKVVFCDTDPGTFTLDPAKARALITPKTKGIVPVHLYGQAADMPRIMALAEEYGLWVLEDCAQAHLATCGGRLVGTFGQAAIFSFYPGKNLGAMGDAGCVVTADGDLSERIALFARHGGKGTHSIEGVNSRMDGLQAAILSAKLPHLAQWTEERRQIAAHYDSLLAGVPQVRTPRIAPGRDHVYHLYVILSERRDELRQFLKSRGIATALHYPTILPLLPAYARFGHTEGDFPVALGHQTGMLSLPMYPELQEGQAAYVAAAIREFHQA